MGSSAKITRGGNKKRVNQGRQEAKLRAQGAKTHTTSIKESVEAKRRLKQRSQAISGELKSRLQSNASMGSSSNGSAAGGPAPIVRMAPRPAPKKKSTNEEQ